MLLLPLALEPTIIVNGPIRSVSSTKFLKLTMRIDVIVQLPRPLDDSTDLEVTFSTTMPTALSPECWQGGEAVAHVLRRSPQLVELL